MAFTIVPVGGLVTVASHTFELQVVDPPIGILLLLAMSSISVYGVMLAGWSSGSKYPLLGAVRASAQMVSYEAALGLTIVTTIIVTGTVATVGSLSTRAIVDSQAAHFWDWNVIRLGVVPFLLFFIAITAELNRPPFDFAEAEQELVGGFHTEYSSIRFALFFLAEFMNTITMSAVVVTLFFGGPDGPAPHIYVLDWVFPIAWFLGKTFAFLFVYVWLRGSAAEAQLRPANGSRMEVPHPGLARVATARRCRRDLRCRMAVLGDRRGGDRSRRPSVQGRPGGACKRRPGYRADDPLGEPIGPGGGPGGATTASAHRARRVGGGRPRWQGSDRFDPVKFLGGFKVTLEQMARPRLTVQYPREKHPKPPRTHGRHVLNRYEDGMEKCIGCELCAGVCPADCIYVRGADNPPDQPVSPGERFGFVYEINYLRCIHCDLCVEACPTEAITETKMFEFSFTNRADAIYTKTRARRRRRRPAPTPPLGGLASGGRPAHFCMDARHVAQRFCAVRRQGPVGGRARIRRARARRGTVGRARRRRNRDKAASRHHGAAPGRRGEASRPTRASQGSWPGRARRRMC